MTAKTHMLGGAIVGLVAVKVTGDVATAPQTIASSVLGALLCDIDCPQSKIGRKLPIISWIVNITCGHRGLFHVPLLYVALYAISLFGVGHSYHLIRDGIFSGNLSHLFLDLLTPGGIPLLYPFIKKDYSLLNIKTGSANEFVLTAFLLVITCLLAKGILLPSIDIDSLLHPVKILF